jgi:rsbT antagonist protein RsbS
MHDRLAMALQDDLTRMISETEARGVLIDISSLEIVDSFIGRMLGNIAAMSRVLDAQTVVVGMQPAVAITLVELGLSLPGVRTGLNVDAGMELLRAAANGLKGPHDSHRHTIRPNNFRVEGLFAALRRMLKPLLSQNSSVNLVFEDPVDIPDLYTDEAKISQILRNFISNALKFTERGEIRVSVQKGRGDSLMFSVADTGIGIAADDQAMIFREWTYP